MPTIELIVHGRVSYFTLTILYIFLTYRCFVFLVRTPAYHGLLDRVIKNPYHAPEAPEFLAGTSGTGSGFIPAMTRSDFAISSRATTRRVLKSFSKHVGHVFASCRQAGGISPPQNEQSALTIIRSIIFYSPSKDSLKFPWLAIVLPRYGKRGHKGEVHPAGLLSHPRHSVQNSFIALLLVRPLMAIFSPLLALTM